jgi:hemoglobin-like flavoprotein
MALKVKVLEQSFGQVKPHGTKFAASFYEKLFDDFPQARSLFANTDMEMQEEKLFRSLSLVILNVRYPGYLETLLKDLGERHVRYGTLQ